MNFNKPISFSGQDRTGSTKHRRLKPVHININNIREAVLFCQGVQTQKADLLLAPIKNTIQTFSCFVIRHPVGLTGCRMENTKVRRLVQLAIDLCRPGIPGICLHRHDRAFRANGTCQEQSHHALMSPNVEDLGAGL